MNQRLKKSLNIFLYSILIFSVTLVIGVYFAIKLPPVQRFLISKVETKLSETLNTKVSVKSVSLDYLSRIILKDLLIEDQRHDTLIFIDKFKAKIQFYSLQKSDFKLSDIILYKPKVRIRKIDSGNLNYSFLLNQNQSEHGNATKKEEKLNLNFTDIQIIDGILNYEDSLNLLVREIFIDINSLNITNDHIGFKLNNLSLNSNKGVQIKEFSLDLDITKKEIQVKQFDLKLNNSRLVINKSEYLYDNYKKLLSPENKYFLSISEKSNLNLQDLKLLNLNIDTNEDLKIKFSGDFSGRVKNFQSNNFKINILDSTEIKIKFRVKNILDKNNLSFNFDIYKFSTEKKDLDTLSEIFNIKLKDYQFLNHINKIDLDCFANGNYRDINLRGTAKMDVGKFNFDVKLNNNYEDKLSKYTLNIKSNNLNLGEVIGDSKFEKIDFNLSIDGSSNFDSLIQNNIAITINSVKYNSYNLKDIKLKLKVSGNKISVKANSSDSIFKFILNSNILFSKSKKIFDINLNLKNINLGALGVANYRKVSCVMKSNFELDNLMNFIGYVQVKDLNIFKDTSNYHFSKFKIYSRNNNDYKNIFVESDYLNGTINGNFNILNIDKIVKKSLANYFPLIDTSFQHLKIDENIKFNFKLTNSKKINKIFNKYKFSKNTSISGSINAKTKSISLKIKTKRFSYKENIVDNFKLQLSTKQNQLVLETYSGNLLIKNEKFENLDLKIKSNVLGSNVVFKFSDNKKNKSRLSLNVKSIYDKYLIKIDESKLYFRDSLWNISKTQVLYDSSKIAIENFEIKSGGKEIKIDGAISKNSKDKLNLKINNFDFDIQYGATNVSTIFNGDVELFDFYNSIKVNSSLKLEKTIYNHENFGDLYIRTYWDKKSKNIVGRIVNRNSKAKIKLKILADSKFNLKASGSLENIPIKVFTYYFDAVRIDGFTSGKVVLTGNISRPLIKADLKVNNATVEVAYTGVKYRVKENEIIKLRDFNFIFDNLIAYDKFGNEVITNGSIYHTNFSNTDMKFSFKPKNAFVIDIQKSDNKEFYGEAFAYGEVILKYNEKFILKTNVKIVKESNIYIPFADAKKKAKSDFITFVNVKDTVDIEEKESLLDMNLDLNFEIDKNSTIFLETGGSKIIEATANGKINIKTNDLGKVLFFGKLKIYSGKYIFNLLNIPIKEFEIVNGGTVNFNGDIFETNADIKCMYRINRVKTSDLGLGVKTRELNVDCLVLLKGKVSENNISFAIDIPETTADAELIKNKINDLSKISMNTQMFSLLLMQRFRPLIENDQTLENNFDLTNSVFGLLAIQLNNILSKVTNNINIGLNYKKGDRLTSDQLQMALSYYFSDVVKIQVQSDVDMNSVDATNNQNKSTDIIKEAEIEIKPMKNSNLKFNVFVKKQNEYELDPGTDNNNKYKQGIGVSYGKDFNSFSELFGSYWNSLFGDKKEKVDKYIIIDTTIISKPQNDSIYRKQKVDKPIETNKAK